MNIWLPCLALASALFVSSVGVAAAKKECEYGSRLPVGKNLELHSCLVGVEKERGRAPAVSGVVQELENVGDKPMLIFLSNSSKSRYRALVSPVGNSDEFLSGTVDTVPTDGEGSNRSPTSEQFRLLPGDILRLEFGFAEFMSRQPTSSELFAIRLTGSFIVAPVMPSEDDSPERSSKEFRSARKGQQLTFSPLRITSPSRITATTSIIRNPDTEVQR